MKMLGNSRNQCQGCKGYFNSVSAFDKHRTGNHGSNRRCMTEEEMLAKGMSLNSDGFWITKTMPVAVLGKKQRTSQEIAE
jgi:hypothetical protein